MGYRLSQLYTASSNISHFYLVSVMPMEATGFGTGYLGAKAEWQRIDASELWCWKRLLRVPWTVRRSSQSILREINPE